MTLKLAKFSWILIFACVNTHANDVDTMLLNREAGFVKLPRVGFSNSAYLTCNATGDYGRANSSAPKDDMNSHCFISTPELDKSENYAPIAGFKMVGMLVSDVPMKAPYANQKNNAVAALTDTFWRNESKTECILGTHLYMQDVPLADGSYWEVSDIARAGFAGLDIEVAYFHKPHSKDEGGNTEVLFRVGRTFTSAPTNEHSSLPAIKGAPSRSTPISENNTAAVSENWVDFTTDVSFKDVDGITRQMTSMLYIKYSCDGRDVVEKPDAIRLRSAGQSGQSIIEIAVPGLVPIDGLVELY